MNWLTVTDPAVRSAVVSGAWGKAPHSPHGVPVPVDDIDTIAVALQVASDLLTRLTGFAVHPSGTAVEQFSCTPRARRLSPSFGPMRSATTVKRLHPDGTTETLLTGWLMWQGSVHFGYGTTYSYYTLDRWYREIICIRPLAQEFLELTYVFGSTITASARRAVLYLANQIWLVSNGCSECEDCKLPERTTAVVREGISYTLSDTTDFLYGGKTGLPSVDGWVAGVNPRQATRRPAVYDPAAPPGVIKSLVRNDPVLLP